TDGKLGYLYDSLNRVQATAWKIDHSNLDLLQALVAAGGGVAGVPSTKELQLPALPHDIDYNEESKRAWKTEAAKAHTEHHNEVSKRVLVDQQLRIATIMKDYPRLYYRWRADFRMRIYPTCSQMSPQTSDSGRGLLKFADGVPLGQHGYKWL